MSKKHEYIVERMKISPIIADEVINFCKNYGSEKYATWIAREVNNNNSIDYNEFPQILDWVYSERPDILKLSFEEAKKHSDVWHKEIAENADDEFANRLNLDENRIIYKTMDGKHFFYLLTPSELKYEGKYMGHCIGSNQFYHNKLKSNQIQIVSLRDENNRPHVTIEMLLEKNGLMKTGQISGKGNKTPIDKYYNMITEYGIYLASKNENKDFHHLMKLMKLNNL